MITAGRASEILAEADEANELLHEVAVLYIQIKLSEMPTSSLLRLGIDGNAQLWQLVKKELLLRLKDETPPPQGRHSVTGSVTPEIHVKQ